MGKDAAAIGAEFQSRLSQMARESGRGLYPEGLPRGTKFSELEAIAGALGDEIARQLIEIHVSAQADDWPEEELGDCPVCGGPARKAPDQPRVLTTMRGEVAWRQRVGNCPSCRRAFFPSRDGDRPRPRPCTAGGPGDWSEPGAEAILRLRADYLSETIPMERFWTRREAQASGNGPYRQVA